MSRLAIIPSTPSRPGPSNAPVSFCRPWPTKRPPTVRRRSRVPSAMEVPLVEYEVGSEGRSGTSESSLRRRQDPRAQAGVGCCGVRVRLVQQDRPVHRVDAHVVPDAARPARRPARRRGPGSRRARSRSPGRRGRRRASAVCAAASVTDAAATCARFADSAFASVVSALGTGEDRAVGGEVHLLHRAVGEHDADVPLGAGGLVLDRDDRALADLAASRGRRSAAAVGPGVAVGRRGRGADRWRSTAGSSTACTPRARPRSAGRSRRSSGCGWVGARRSPRWVLHIEPVFAVRCLHAGQSPSAQRGRRDRDDAVRQAEQRGVEARRTRPPGAASRRGSRPVPGRPARGRPRSARRCASRPGRRARASACPRSCGVGVERRLLAPLPRRAPTRYRRRSASDRISRQERPAGAGVRRTTPCLREPDRDERVDAESGHGSPYETGRRLGLRTSEGGGGGDDGNRTRTTSLEDWSSAIELHPRDAGPSRRPDHRTGSRRAVDVTIAR